MQTVAENDPQAPPRLWTADLAIVTIPFSALRFVEIVPSMSYKKRRAIIETHYDQATKVLLEFSHRWWEFTEADWRDELDRVAPGLYEYYRLGAQVDAEPALTFDGSGTDLLAAAVKDSSVTEEMRQLNSTLPLRGPAVRPATHCFGGLGHRQPQPVHVLPLAPGRGQHRRRRARLVLLVGRRRPLGTPSPPPNATSTP
ncbi:hypothetical protein SVIOM74S_09776 [Streptomyces violarus]